MAHSGQEEEHGVGLDLVDTGQSVEQRLPPLEGEVFEEPGMASKVFQPHATLGTLNPNWPKATTWPYLALRPANLPVTDKASRSGKPCPTKSIRSKIVRTSEKVVKKSFSASTFTSPSTGSERFEAGEGRGAVSLQEVDPGVDEECHGVIGEDAAHQGGPLPGLVEAAPAASSNADHRSVAIP